MHLPLSDPYFPDKYSNLWLRETLIPHLRSRFPNQPDEVYDQAAVAFVMITETRNLITGVNSLIMTPAWFLGVILGLNNKGLSASLDKPILQQELDRLRKDVEKGPNEGEF